MKSQTNIIIERIANYGLFHAESPLYVGCESQVVIVLIRSSKSTYFLFIGVGPRATKPAILVLLGVFYLFQPIYKFPNCWIAESQSGIH